MSGRLTARSYVSVGGTRHSSIQARDPTGVLRRTARRIASSEANDLLSRAIGVSEERVVEDTLDSKPRATTMRRIIVKNVEVPVKRKVKVPVKTVDIVPTKQKQRVLVKRLVQVPSFKEVEEEYTVVEHRAVMRDKEVWVKKIVQEEYMEPFEVKKMRKKRVPTTSLKEVEEWQDVEVTTDMAVTKDGYRVDDVEDVKLVEVKEEQVYELVPRLRDERVLMSARDLGMQTREQHLTRHLGTRTFMAGEVEEYALDEFPSDMEVVPAAVRHIRTRIGMVVSQLRSERRGVRVKMIRRGYPAEKAGLVAGDVITHVDGTATHDLAEFRATVYRSAESLVFTVIRGTKISQITVVKTAGTSPLRGAGARAMTSARMSARGSARMSARGSARGGYSYETSYKSSSKEMSSLNFDTLASRS